MIFLFIGVFLIALVFSMFGLGGGLFYMPLFMFFVGDLQQAALLSFLCIFVTAGSSALKYYKLKKIDWRLVFFLGIPLMAMVFLSGFLTSMIDEELVVKILGITLALAGFSLAAPVGMLNFFSFFSKRLYRVLPSKDFAFNPILMSPITVIVGFFCGVSGVAGGAFEIPIMIGCLRVSPHLAIGTSSMIVFLSSFLGIASRMHFLFDSQMLSSFMLFGVLFFVFLGAQVGPMISVNINKKVFKRICGFVVLAIGICYIVRVIF